MNEKNKIYDDKMTKTINNLDGELATIRAGRANPHVLDKLAVDYYGTPTPIQQVANVSVPEARMIQIQPWEKSIEVWVWLYRYRGIDSGNRYGGCICGFHPCNQVPDGLYQEA